MTALRRLVIILSQQGSARAPQKRDLEVKPWRYVVGLPWQKLCQISPKTSVYIGGREGTLYWGSRSPKGVGRVQGGRTPPPQTELDLVWWEGVPLPSHLLLFFLFS